MTDLKTDIKNAFKYFNNDPVVREHDHEYILEGKLNCCVEGYRELDDVFDVIINVPFDFPRQLPSVVEMGGKIPRTIDYHMDKNGKCCLGTEVALFDFIHKENITSFDHFLERVIIVHLFQVKHFLVKGKWLQEPEAHYTPGVIDSYKRIFNLTENELKRSLSGKFKRYNKCLCKSNRRFDKCHGKYISVEQIQKDSKNILAYLQGRI
jgi:hypothetical protein